MKPLLVAGLLLSTAVPMPLSAQEQTSEACGGAALNLGIHCSGLSFGNSHRWSGIRFNFIDRDVDRTNGLNVTFWRSRYNEWAEYNGLSVGIAPEGGWFRGLNVGAGALVARHALVGVNVALLGLVSNGDAIGINVAGLGTVANRDLVGVNLAALGTVANRQMQGLNVAGLGTVANRNMHGINVAGLGLVANRDMHGINIAGLGAVANRDMRGISIAGLGVVANGSMEGLTVAGLGAVANRGITGIAVAGLGVVANHRPITGAAITVGELRGEAGIRGFAVGGYRVCTDDMRGWSTAVAWTKIEELRGVSVAGVNYVYGSQRGLTIGIFNYTEELHGVQIGLLNYAGNNEGIAKILPIVNAHLN
ncbi:MAG: hypothetical protein PVH40_02815 [Gemmatimonadales bacterium]|jgi:hypothetical protein